MALEEVLHPTTKIPLETAAKFHANGGPKLFPGITVLCHLGAVNPSQNQLRQAMAAHLPDLTSSTIVGEGQVTLPHHVKLPEDSWHMTIFDTSTYDTDRWAGPKAPGATRDADIQKYKQTFNSKAELEFRHYLPIRMKIDLSGCRHPRNGHPLNVPVTPLNEIEADKLSKIRHWFVREFDRPIRNSNYVFHVSTHYQLKYMDEEEFDSLRGRWVEAVAKIAGEIDDGRESGKGYFEVDRVELCSFDDMMRFDVVASVGYDDH